MTERWGVIGCSHSYINLMVYLREAFQSKNQRTLGISPNRGGGRQKINKVPSFKIRGGSSEIKKSQVPEGIKD